MKKIIGGKKYDTETARFIGEDGFSNSRDFNHWSEELYQKRTGEFFLYGEGGPLSRYAEVTGQNEWSGGEKIIPLSYDSAREWAEEHLDADDYESVFGEITEDDSKRPLTVSIQTEVFEMLSRMSAESGKSKSEIVENALRAYK